MQTENKKRQYFLQRYGQEYGYIVTRKDDHSHYYQNLSVPGRWGVVGRSISETSTTRKIEPISEKWIILRGYSLLEEKA